MPLVVAEAEYPLVPWELLPFVAPPPPCPFELLESFRPRTVEAPDVREDKLKAGEVPRLIVSVPEEV